MIPEKIKNHFTREILWDEVNAGDEGVPEIGDPTLYKAWELGELIHMEIPPLSAEGIVLHIHHYLTEMFDGAVVGEFNEHWKRVYDKYGFIHLRTEVFIGSDRYHVEIFCHDPHGKKRIDDAVFSNSENPLGGKHFYM